MSISVLGVGVVLLLKTIPASFEKSDLLEFTFGPEPIIKLIAWEVVTLEIDFICAAPHVFVTWCVVCRGILCMRLNGIASRSKVTFLLPFNVIREPSPVGSSFKAENRTRCRFRSE